MGPPTSTLPNTSGVHSSGASAGPGEPRTSELAAPSKPGRISSTSRSSSTHPGSRQTPPRWRKTLKQQADSFPTGRKIHGFTVIRSALVKELDLVATLLVHDATQLRYIHVARADGDNVFALAFKTPPRNSQGDAHVLEHYVLAGSKKYPVSNPFLKMMTRCLSTYMNAVTVDDFTVYPFSTQNRVDYDNLRNVYLDLTLNPLLQEADFLQEAWRIEPMDLQHPDSPLELKGVVYNEMKSIRENSQSWFLRDIKASLLSETVYAHNSGGNPDEIPKLTWQGVKDFHHGHYNLTNARVFSYGDILLEEHLLTMNGIFKELSIPPGPEVPRVNPQSPHKRPMTVHFRCAPNTMEIAGFLRAKGNSHENHVSVARAYMLCQIFDAFENFCLKILSQLLTGGPNSPFHHALIESNLGSSYTRSVGYVTCGIHPYFIVGVQDVAESKVAAVEEAIHKTFERCAKNGFGRSRVFAILHGIELDLKHQDTGFGLKILNHLVFMWNHDEDPLNTLQINSLLSQFRKTYEQNPMIFQELIMKYFLRNPHHVTAILTPDAKVPQERAEVERITIEDKQNAMDSTERERYMMMLRIMRDKMDDFEDKDTMSLPILQLSEIETTVRDSEGLSHRFLRGVDVQYSAQPTNGLTYVAILVNCNDLPAEYQDYLPLFARCVTKLGAGDLDFKALSRRIDTHTGGMSAFDHLRINPMNADEVEEGVLFYTFALNEDVPEMFNILAKIFIEFNPRNVERIRSLLKQEVSSFMSSLVHRGNTVAKIYAAKTLCVSGRLKERFVGMYHLRLIKGLLESQSRLETVPSVLSEMARHILTKKQMRCCLNTNPEYMHTAMEQMDNFLDRIGGKARSKFPRYKSFGSDPFQATSQRVNLVMPLNTNFTALAFPGVPPAHKDYAPLQILAKILQWRYLMPEIRVKNSAYAAGVSLNEMPNVFCLWSYRDPVGYGTFKSFKKAIDWVTKEASFSDEDIHEAKLTVFQEEDRPIPPGEKGLDLFLKGMSQEMRNEHRRRLLAANKEDIVRVARQYLKNAPYSGSCLFGAKIPTSSKPSRGWRLIEA